MELIVKHGERLEKKHPPNPSSGVLPLQLVDRIVTNDQRREERCSPVSQLNKPLKQRYDSLEQLASKQSDAVFRGQVIIKHTIPMLKNSSELWMFCPFVDKRTDTRSFRFGLCLDDGYTSLDAIVANSAGENFFQGMTAAEACESRIDDAFSVLSCIERRKKFRVEVASVRVNNAKYFLVTSISWAGTVL